VIGATVPFEVHAEVWTLILGVVALGWYTARVVQPKAVAAGYPPITRTQKSWFLLAVILMWVVSDWPVHEIAEQHLYFVHMFQHLFLSMLVPLFFVLATPRWLFELVIIPGSPLWRFFRTGSKPLVAGVVFNGLTMLLHWSQLVQLSFENGTIHFALHLLIFVAGLLMWMPVFGPVHEWRLTPLAQCFYLFSMSIIPTVPGGWLVFAEDVVYRHYDTPDRLWGIEVLTDQQAAGVVMKLVGGFFLWGLIFFVFTRWATREMAKGEQERTERQRAERERLALARAEHVAGSDTDAADVLTFEQISQEFARTPPAPTDDEV
jgi:cytochrome c oxidase assembly factor CtaG